MKAKLLAAGVAILLAGASNVALAKPTTPTVYVMKYTGTVYSGYDSQDLFGGGNLQGDAFTEVFDVTAADVNPIPGGYGALGSGGSDPISLASLTINGKTVTLSPTAITLDGGKPKTAKTSAGAVTLIDTHSKGLLFDTQSDTVCKSRSDCDVYTIAGGVTDLSSGSLFPTSLQKQWDIKTGGGVVDGGSIFSVKGPCFDETLLLHVTSAAPEPKTWLLMFTGLGLLGMSLRRRQGQAVAVTA